jgi:hypothetical protein
MSCGAPASAPALPGEAATLNNKSNEETAAAIAAWIDRHLTDTQHTPKQARPPSNDLRLEY